MMCFVACAFGHSDVNAKFNVIKRVLKSLGITVRRVDRIEFNSKIDNKILELINKCDFGIGDSYFGLICL